MGASGFERAVGGRQAGADGDEHRAKADEVRSTRQPDWQGCVGSRRDLARKRRYIDNLGSIQWSEFTIYQSLCFPSAVYPVLAQGGKWDETKDPFAVPQD
jgi:hypothetical protein